MKIIKFVLVILFFIYFGKSTVMQGQTISQTSDVIFDGTSVTPVIVTVTVGDTIRWLNTTTNKYIEVASDPHPLHTYYPPLNLGLVYPGSSKNFQTIDVGTYAYHDHLTPAITGTIIVNPQVSASPSPTPSAQMTDINQDRKVNLFDSAFVIANFGKNGSAVKGDVNLDSRVDELDLLQVIFYFGSRF